MAKGLRSKTMRRNRSALRATLICPIDKKRIEKCAAEGTKTNKDRTGGTIDKLRAVLKTGGKESTLTNNELPVEAIPVPPASQARIKDRIAFLKSNKKSGSKPRAKGDGKDMVWF